MIAWHKHIIRSDSAPKVILQKTENFASLKHSLLCQNEIMNNIIDIILNWIKILLISPLHNQISHFNAFTRYTLFTGFHCFIVHGGFQ